MKDARDENTFRFRTVEDHMLAMLMSAKARTNLIRGTANSRILGKHFATFFKRVQIAMCLGFAPSLKRVAPAGPPRLAVKNETSPRLPGDFGELKLLSYSPEHVARSNTACIAFVDG